MGYLFSEEQLEYLYKDQSFVAFLSDYFTSFGVTNQNTDMDIDEEGIENINIYARILLANVGNFFEMLDELNGGISFSHKKVVQSCLGEIRGVLLINQYAKEVVSQHFPRKYECIQKKKTYCTPENVLVYFALLRIRESMELFLNSANDTSSATWKNFRKSPEYSRIIDCIGTCEDYLASKFLTDCIQEATKYRNMYGSSMPVELLEAVDSRIRDERINNIILYKKIVEWINKFLRKGLVFNTSHATDILRYDEDFADVLFELWTLHELMNTLSIVYTFDTIEYFKFKREDGLVYKCTHGQDTIEFIYQKGKDVYWNDTYPVSWNYVCPSLKSLMGKPDISIRVSGSKNRLIMFDAKNRVRENGHVSEEVYKMIGYFDNFKKMLESPTYDGTPKECILFFRGDEKPFVKRLKKDNSQYCIDAVSVSPTKDKILNKDQFEYIVSIVVSILG